MTHPLNRQRILGLLVDSDSSTFFDHNLLMFVSEMMLQNFLLLLNLIYF